MKDFNYDMELGQLQTMPQTMYFPPVQPDQSGMAAIGDRFFLKSSCVRSISVGRNAGDGRTGDRWHIEVIYLDSYLMAQRHVIDGIEDQEEAEDAAAQIARNINDNVVR